MILPDGFDAPRLVGSGGLGDVYVATRTSTGGEVAVKVLRQQGGHAAVLRRARRERDALASLRGHPHVVHLEDVLQTDDAQVMLVMEYMSGGAVDDYARRVGGTLSVEQTLLVGEQAASALSAAHGLGVVHRDIKPQNLLINSFGHVKVCDFGISSLGASAEFAERTDALSYRYASPEEIRGDDHIGPLTDVYSLGVTLAALMTGRFFTHETRERLLDEDSVPSVTGDPMDAVERSLRELIVSCLSSDLAERPDSEALARKLSGLAADLGSDRSRNLPRVAGGPGSDRASALAPRPGAPAASAPATSDSETRSPATPSTPATPAASRRVQAGTPPGAGGAGRRSRSRATVVLWLLVVVIFVAIVVLTVVYLTDRTAEDSLVDAMVVTRRGGSPTGLPPF